MPLPMGSTPFADDDLKAIGEVVVAGALLERMFDFCIWRFVQGGLDVGVSVTAGIRTSSKIKMLGTLGLWTSLTAVRLWSPSAAVVVSQPQDQPSEPF